MKAQRQASGGVTAVVAQPMSHHALPGGVAGGRLTNGVRCASMAGMNRRAEMQIPRGGGCSPSLNQQRLNLSRAGKHYRGFGRAAKRLGMTDLFAGGSISIAATADPAHPASAAPISGFGSSLSAEQFSQSMPRRQQPPLRSDSYRVAAERRSGFKVRDAQPHIHTTERKL